MSLFGVPIESLKGVGAKRARLFRKLGVNSVGDLLLFYPRSYENWNKITSIADAPTGEVCCVKAYLATPVSTASVKGAMIISHATVFDDTAPLKLTFFNNKYISSMLKAGEEYYFLGKVDRGIYGPQMISPKFLKVGKAETLRPIYNLTAGLPNGAVCSAAEQAIALLPEKIKDPLPQFLLRKYSLCNYGFAIRNIHFPNTSADLECARRRLIFQELLTLTLGLSGLKMYNSQKAGEPLKIDFTDEYLALLPFKMTDAQRRALDACADDMRKAAPPMHRLIQGDVGSGKTAVAAGVCYFAAKNGFQAAFMAPTEILAQQHYKSLTALFSAENIKVDLLIGALSAARKKQVRARLESGETQVVIGTHALITEATVFKNLGAVVTDEQHRFGVAQRTSLAEKGKAPHLLVMSATPIPRTLGLTVFGDLDISVIDCLPPGRQPIKTVLINSDKRSRALNFVKKEINSGRQAYIVCPLVEEGEGELASAENYAAELMLSAFSEYPVGILHGKMKSAEKEKVMAEFSSGKISVLVSTTVVEVGVDVPNATVMMIENAERFGLSQLHQLRGRVGRGRQRSYCILVSDSQSKKTLDRLNIMCRTSDGFEIAEEDLKARGPGDFFGERQHGLPELRIANLSDIESLENAQSAAKEILAFSPDLSAPQLKGLKTELKRLFSNAAQN